MVRVDGRNEVQGELISSLWRCEFCDTFVSIHSTRVIVKANCPTCAAGHLNYCGNFEQIVGPGFLDA